GSGRRTRGAIPQPGRFAVASSGAGSWQEARGRPPAPARRPASGAPATGRSRVADADRREPRACDRSGGRRSNPAFDLHATADSFERLLARDLFHRLADGPVVPLEVAAAVGAVAVELCVRLR